MPRIRFTFALAAAAVPLAAVSAARAAISLAADYNFATTITSTAAASAAGLTTYGTPAYSSGFVTLDGSSWLNDSSTPLTAKTNFGIELLFKAPSVSGSHFLMVNNNGANNGFGLLQQNDTVSGYGENNGGPVGSGYTIIPNVVYAMAVVRSGTTNSFYVNGSLIGSSTTSDPPTPTTLTLGASQATNTGPAFELPFVGSIRQARAFTFAGGFAASDLLKSAPLILDNTGQTENVVSTALTRDQVIVGDTAYGELHVAGGGTLTASYGVVVGNRSGGNGRFDLDGGVTATPAVQGGAGNSALVFNGGTLKATANSTDFTAGLSRILTRDYGAIIDTNGFDVTVTQAIADDPDIGGPPKGPTGVQKYGAGTLTFTGNDQSYGSSTVYAGTLSLGNGGATGSLNSTYYVEVAAGANLTVNRSDNVVQSGVVGGLQGAGSLTKAGAGVLTLDISNSAFTGGTNLNAGTLMANAPSSLGVGGTISFGGGTLRYGSANAADYSSRLSTAAGQAIRVDTNAQSVTFATALTSRDGTLTKLGAGTLSLTAANSYSGATTVSAGTLKVSGTYQTSGYAIASGAVMELSTDVQRDYASTTFTGGGTLRKTGSGVAFWGVSAATFALGSNALIDVKAGTFTGGSSRNEVWTDNLSDLNVDTGATFNGVEANVRVDVLTGGGTIATGFKDPDTVSYTTFTIGVANGSGTFSGTLANTDATNAGNLTKIGSGTQTFTGANTYTGGTTINAGTIRANNATNALGSGVVAINRGGTLGGSGTIANGTNAITVASGGTVTAGADSATAGKLTTGKQVWAGGGKYAWKLATNTSAGGTAGTNWDLLSITALDLSGLSTSNKFTIAASFLGSGSIASGSSFLIARVATLTLPGGVSTPAQVVALFTLNTSGLPALSGGQTYSLQFTPSGGGGDLSINCTPEPTTATLFGLSLSPALLRRRRRA